jgi:hypothetical protein
VKSSVHTLTLNWQLNPLNVSLVLRPTVSRTVLEPSESESESLYEWRFTPNQFVSAPSPLRHRKNFFYQLNTCCHSPYVTSSLTRGWVCRLQLLLALASAFILRSEYRRTHDHILLSQIRDSPNPELRSRIYIPQEQGGPVITPALCSLSVAIYDSQGYGGGNSNLHPPWRFSPLCLDA